MSNQPKRIKLAIVGDGGVGKTSYITRFLNGTFIQNYNETLGVNVNSLPFNTNEGPIIFDVWDCCSIGQLNNYLTNSDIVIVFFDVTNRNSFNNLNNWLAIANNVVLKENIIVCGNKVDKGDREVLPKEVSLEYTYFDISVKNNYNYEKPLLHAARKMFGKDLNFENN